MPPWESVVLYTAMGSPSNPSEPSIELVGSVNDLGRFPVFVDNVRFAVVGGLVTDAIPMDHGDPDALPLSLKPFPISADPRVPIY